MNEHTRDPDKDPEQAAVIPLRRDRSAGVQVCLMRRKDSAKWGLPKGYIEGDRSWGQAALAEADEEVGLRGHIIGESVGTYVYSKGVVGLTVVVFVMEVLEEREAWREMQWRKRRWCTLEEANELLKGHRVWPLFDRIQSSLATMLPDTPR
jgi:8-oxo-dGTP pyrophosphatase MutT (NUDIX family)